MKRRNDKLESLVEYLKTLPEGALEDVVDAVYAKLATNQTHAVDDVSSECVAVCKWCGATHVVKNGTDRHGRTRYWCRECGKTFMWVSGTVFAGSSKNALVWKQYIHALLEGKSIVACANACGIAPATSFVWRHKLLNALATRAFAERFDGILEIDEMFIRISYKGNHTKSKNFVMPRESFKRGSDSHIPGNNSKACVLCVVERNKGFSGVVPCRGMMNAVLLSNLLENRISNDSIVLTDGLRAYNQYFRTTSAAHIVLPSRQHNKPTVDGAYHINNVNALHGRFRRFLRVYNGVSTKYLSNYLALFLWIENNKNNREEQLYDIALQADSYVTASNLVALAPAPEFAPAA